ncbi:hypothetical protein ACFWPQ_28445 [Streptomyces sp. NPDC058464]|uniref:hypothetical protein n=1 Tax=Streptomyces sp. NPDC058464 TaxID=3346511 RepID=UPI003662CFE0
MKVVQITGLGAADDVLPIDEVDPPAPGTGELPVSAGASRVNGHDVLVRTRKAQTVSGRRFPMGAGSDIHGAPGQGGSAQVSAGTGDLVPHL